MLLSAAKRSDSKEFCTFNEIPKLSTKYSNVTRGHDIRRKHLRSSISNCNKRLHIIQYVICEENYYISSQAEPCLRVQADNLIILSLDSTAEEVPLADLFSVCPNPL
ncbi:hypothetical protein J6590_095420 [Homalodisca vitripennis]|nr:hypothetical protein J6590_095420 [Homalodisca vitripennis]